MAGRGSAKMHYAQLWLPHSVVAHTYVRMAGSNTCVESFQSVAALQLNKSWQCPAVYIFVLFLKRCLCCCRCCVVVCCTVRATAGASQPLHCWSSQHQQGLTAAAPRWAAPPAAMLGRFLCAPEQPQCGKHLQLSRHTRCGAICF